jgi:peptidoglycan/xylan/chitin deacetylase (PgdA/CDA1 family)
MQTSILMYHSIDDSSSVLSISPSSFERQMRWLSDQGYKVVPLRHVVENIAQGNGVPPERSVVITFDDGCESVYQNALPSLIKYGFSATIFLVAGYVGKLNNWTDQPPGIPRLSLANWSQIREMDQCGIEFGSHTINHIRLDQVPIEEARIEVCQSRTIIEQKLGHAIDLFAYPYGKYNQSLLAVVENTYAGACSTDLGLVSPHSNPFKLERIEMYYLRNPLVFQSVTKPAMSAYLRTRRGLRTLASGVLKRQW